MKQAGKGLIAMVLMLGLVCGFAVSPGRCASPGEGSPEKKKEAAPRIEFKELKHDFGKSFQNATLKHTFSFKNTGDAVLIVEKVKAG